MDCQELIAKILDEIEKAATAWEKRALRVKAARQECVEALQNEGMNLSVAGLFRHHQTWTYDLYMDWKWNRTPHFWFESQISVLNEGRPDAWYERLLAHNQASQHPRYSAASRRINAAWKQIVADATAIRNENFAKAQELSPAA